MDYTVKVLPAGSDIPIKENQTLLSALKEAGFYIRSNCGGCASCGTCILKITKGEEFLSVIEQVESKLIGNVFHLTKERLSCQVKVFGDITVDISNHNEKQSEADIQKRESKKILLKKSATIQAEQEAAELEVETRERPKKEGGLKRPKAFNFSDEEES